MPERKLSGWVSQKSGKEILLLVSILFLTKLIGTEAAPSLSSATRSETALAAKTLTLGLREAVLLGLQNNQALRVEKLTPAVRKTYEEEEKARFDPTLEAGLSLSRQHAQTPSRTTGALTGTTSSQVNLSGGFSRLLPGGTSFVTELSTAKDWSSLYSNLHTTRLGLTVTQALLQGADVEANLARLRQARLDSFASEYELQALAENIVAEIEKTYWQYALARREIEIYQDSLKLAEQQLKETEEKISVGKLAEIELAAAQAEVALRREALINATSKMESIRLQLLRLLNPPDGSWESEVILKDLPAVPQVKLDAIENHCALALRLRPELQQARLSLQRNEVELVKTKNGLLPKLDFFLTLGKTGYANSFGGSLQDITGKGYEVAAGLAFQWPVGNRQAKAQYQRARLSRQQAEEALENLSQLVILDVRSAYLEVNRTYQQITAVAATRVLQEEKLRAETEKFRVGRSTPLLVAQTQRDLLSSQIAEIEAVVNYLTSLVDLFRLEGSLLERRGLSVEKVSP